MEIADDTLRPLDFALSNQAKTEVINFLRLTSGSVKMQAARLVMGFLVNPNDPDQYSEFCTSFLDSLLAFMISFVSELVLERVSALSSSQSNRAFLSKRFECKLAHSSMHASSKVDELEECGKYLSLLRKLESDIRRVREINAGEAAPEPVLTRAGSMAVSPFPEVTPVESVTEKCLLVSNPCTGMYWLSQRVDRFTSKQMRATARLIAYLFITSPSLDSFFVGIHILRNSGHHVEEVLHSFYQQTSIKFVRDRIASHLAHRGFEPNANLMLLESLYPNNCYWTELNRAWSRLACGNNTQGRISSNGFTAVDCGNISDIAEKLEKPASGQIGSVSQEESLSVLKCTNCLDSKHNFVDTEDSVVNMNRRGYLYVTSAWIELMTEDEIAKICMEAGGRKIDLEYAVFHKDWRSILNFDFSNQYSTVVSFDHGKFINRLLLETAMSQGLGREPGRADLARIRRLFTDNLDSADAKFHAKILIWFLVENDYPQLALLYMRRFGLGDTYESADELCNLVPGLEFLAKGRLGRIVQPPVSPLEHIAVWMTTHELAEPVHLVSDLIRPEPSDIVMPEIPGDIFDAKSFKNDISLRELLQDLFPDLELEVLGRNVRIGTGVPSEVDMLEYYIAQGRPSLAHARLGLPVDSKILQKAARRVAMYNLFDDGIVASAIALLDLFSEPTETLRVDVHCARTIGKEVRDLFLNFDKGQTQLLAALKLLEESAWAKEPPIGADQAPAPGGFESPWHLVALFCRVHNLPRSLTLLHELARNGDWVMFLHESDLQQCPVETVQDVVQLYFENSSPLRSHLNILLDVRPSSSPRLDDSKPHDHALNQDEDRITKLKKALSLFKFSKAKEIYATMNEPEKACVEEYRDGPMAREIGRITECVETEQVRKKRRPTVVLEDEDTKCAFSSTPISLLSPGIGVPNILSAEALKKALHAREYGEVQGIVDTEQAADVLVEVLVGILSKNDICEDKDLEAMLGLAADPVLAQLGDKLQAVKATGQIRKTLDRLTYFAYAKAFVPEEKFECLSANVEPLGGSNNESTARKSVKLPVAARLVEEVVNGRADGIRIDLVTQLGAAIRISRKYRSMCLLRKHLDANHSGEKLLRRIHCLRQMT